MRCDRGWELPRLPFPFKLLLAIVIVWWGFHHPLFLLVAALVYLLVIRRFVHRRRWPGHSRSWDGRRYRTGWH